MYVSQIQYYTSETRYCSLVTFSISQLWKTMKGKRFDRCNMKVTAHNAMQQINAILKTKSQRELQHWQEQLKKWRRITFHSDKQNTILSTNSGTIHFIKPHTTTAEYMVITNTLHNRDFNQTATSGLRKSVAHKKFSSKCTFTRGLEFRKYPIYYNTYTYTSTHSYKGKWY